MSEGNGELINENKPQDIVLTVTMMQGSGQLQVQGPGNGKLFDEPMCFYLLEKAKDFIKSANARAMQPNVVVPNASMAQQARNFFKR